ncbi:SMI1/KNR4 family protein [Streptomyces sp. B3I8]|uniref:SMI1/KNR4 family protein n=1 Tax=Streptomyces sp. B3I8 TaxID=3042303 RepID=UPI0027855661|nr:SMI1/KNR4 family protein [Streptomyces sp. B3I8]MDQ0787208.1 hypothetical protein [Streptomyces sp. B3I8]
MAPPTPLTVEEWRAFLDEHNTGIFESARVRAAIEEDRQVVSPERWEAGWAGAEPVGEEAIVAAEERLGVRLPPSYRNFLKVSDGFERVGPVHLLPLERIGWFADLDDGLIDAWAGPEDFEEYLTVLKRCVVIGQDDGGTGCWWLLHVDSAGEDGECTAYDWSAGEAALPEPYDDFATMVREESRMFL